MTSKKTSTNELGEKFQPEINIGPDLVDLVTFVGFGLIIGILIF